DLAFDDADRNFTIQRLERRERASDGPPPGRRRRACPRRRSRATCRETVTGPRTRVREFPVLGATSREREFPDMGVQAARPPPRVERDDWRKNAAAVRTTYSWASSVSSG